MGAAEQALLALAAKLSPGSRELTQAVADAGAELKAAVERHYTETSASGFRKGQVTKGQVSVVTGTDRAEVSIDSKELAHLIRGGVVRPTPPRRALAIPLTAEARAAGNPSNNRIPGVFRPKGTRVLARKGPGGALEVLWALAAQVTHRAHPEMEPPAADLDASVRGALDRALRQQIPEIQ